jgi:hypothetical protein
MALKSRNLTPTAFRQMMLDCRKVAEAVGLQM